MAMMSVYIDDSGKPGDQTVICLGGLISDAVQWGRLEGEWQRALDAFNIKVPFHMSAFEARKKPPWSELSDSQRASLIARLTGIMRRRVRTRVYTVILLPEFRLTLKEKTVRRMANALCALGCASRVNFWSRSYAEGAPVAYIFEGGSEGDATAFKAFDELVATGHPEAQLIGTRSKDDKNRQPLQAADIWAYEVRKYFHEWAYLHSKRPIRASFETLLGIPDGKGFIYTGDKLEKLRSEIIRNKGMIVAKIRADELCRSRLPVFTWKRSP
jgi:hypothetical protein